MDYSSTLTIESQSYPGVRFTVRRMSFGRRLELMKRVRAAAGALEFEAAGDTMTDKVDAAMTSCTLDRMYFEWGFEGIDGLQIDGTDVDAITLLDRGPEPLVGEIVEQIRRECGLSENERKN